MIKRQTKISLKKSIATKKQRSSEDQLNKRIINKKKKGKETSKEKKEEGGRERGRGEKEKERKDHIINFPKTIHNKKIQKRNCIQNRDKKQKRKAAK